MEAGERTPRSPADRLGIEGIGLGGSAQAGAASPEVLGDFFVNDTRILRFTLLTALASISLTGCDSMNGAGGNTIDGNRGLAADYSGPGRTSGEPNDGFAQALVAVFDANRQASLQGTASSEADVDVFDLGELPPGTRIVIDSLTPSSSLDITLTLFDSFGRLAVHNDDESSNNLDARIDYVTRRERQNYYLAVSPSYFAGSGTASGSYQVNIELGVGKADIPEPRNQVLLLDFDGGFVEGAVLAPEGSYTLEAFDAADISSRYAGQTAELIQLIKERVQENYVSYDVTVLTTNDLPIPDEVEFTTIFFGGFDRDVFGIASQVDPFNIDHRDNAIVYVQSFNPDNILFTPTIEELALGIANVATHESSHLLGLHHVEDSFAIMNARFSPDQLLLDLFFRRSRLSNQVNLIGAEDADLLLRETVGPRP